MTHTAFLLLRTDDRRALWDEFSEEGRRRKRVDIHESVLPSYKSRLCYLTFEGISIANEVYLCGRFVLGSSISLAAPSMCGELLGRSRTPFPLGCSCQLLSMSYQYYILLTEQTIYRSVSLFIYKYIYTSLSVSSWPTWSVFICITRVESSRTLFSYHVPFGLEA